MLSLLFVMLVPYITCRRASPLPKGQLWASPVILRIVLFSSALICSLVKLSSSTEQAAVSVH